MKISLIVPIRGNRDIKPLIDSAVNRNVEIIPVHYECAIWNVSRAVNIGIKKSMGDIIAKVDADIVLPSGFIDEVIGAGDRLCVAPVMRQEKDQCVDAALDNPIWANLKSWYWPCGGWQSAPREFWFDLHGYDEDMIFYGAEDTDMWNRAYCAGLPVEIVNPIVHRWHESKAHKWAFFHVGNAKLREARFGSTVRNLGGWGRVGQMKPGIELARWLLNVTKVSANIRDGSVGRGR